jgi:hypothetical protein
MPKGPQGQKRKADVIGNAVHVMRIATGDEQEADAPDPKAVKRGKAGGAKGGTARAAKLTAKQRTEIAKVAATTRWKKSP